MLRQSIGKIAAAGCPLIIIDDGSLPLTASILQEIANQNAQATLIRLEQNQGKGAAIMAGMRLALASGYSHALQIDADGQHDAGDIASFLQQSAQRPDCLINGTPVYDTSVPKSRLYGRNITNFWVAVATWSLDIKDAMCGFRVYPVKTTVYLLNNQKFSRRMGFDIEILVRSYWQGIRIINHPTKVIYPENGTSNFKMVADNIKISWLHTRLFFGMLQYITQCAVRKIRHLISPRGAGN